MLDLHGAPGGQTGANIDDSPHRLPELFTDPDAYAQGLRLWRLLAERYAHDPTVIAYDLLNEPLPEQHAHLVPRLAEFYRDATAEIRAVDPHHLLSIEGWHWSTRFDGLERLWDENFCLHFHKYWSEPTTDSIRPYLDLRERLGVPLWMGESGENQESWYTEAFSLFEHHRIPWTFWTWKSTAPPRPVIPPRRWDELARSPPAAAPRPREISRTSSTSPDYSRSRDARAPGSRPLGPARPAPPPPRKDVPMSIEPRTPPGADGGASVEEGPRPDPGGASRPARVLTGCGAMARCTCSSCPACVLPVFAYSRSPGTWSPSRTTPPSAASSSVGGTAELREPLTDDGSAAW